MKIVIVRDIHGVNVCLRIIVAYIVETSSIVGGQ